MGVGEVKVTAKSLEKRKKRLKYTKIIVIVAFLLLLISFFILSIIYKGGRFTVTLDPNFTLKSGIVLFESKNDINYSNKLYAKEIEFMDNISGEWIPKDINDEKDGSHNGENYIAYTFYVGNTGDQTINYWYRIKILDVIKNVDEAIRIVVYENGVKTVYAKASDLTGKAEPDTIEFYSNKYAMLKQRKHLAPKENDKFTVVIYLEGDDPECVDAIIGGELKLKMEIMEEHIENKGKKE
ncbi:MAG: hypothetical protein IKG27_04980 [Bacilli bacterium]|nr:hypothetical protein [Bacilli bacterium]